MNKDTLSVTIISNVVFEPYLRLRLKEVFSEKKVLLTNILYEESMDPKNEKSLQTADIILVIINFDELNYDCVNNIFSGKITIESMANAVTEKSRELYFYIKKLSAAQVIWFGFEDYGYEYDRIVGTLAPMNGVLDSINFELNRMIGEEDTYVDFKRLIADIGIKNSYDKKAKYRWNAPYSKELTCRICEEIHDQYMIRKGDTKKCIILDCDNVLWGGILSEDGIGHIRLGDGLGRPYQDFQRFLLTLYYHGVILAICSKNDEQDVLNMFREHSGMILKEEHIACFKVNWNNKPSNVKQISSELNIGLDSMVFIDDSDFEIHSMEALLPEVVSIRYNHDTVYDDLSCFKLKDRVNFENVEQRNRTYQTNYKRTLLKRESRSFDEYLEKLEIKAEIHETTYNELSRISELTQRTNKCTNGIRYTLDRLKARLGKGDYKLYSVFLSDKFSDLGLVGAVGIENNILDLFSLSCRALGRRVEDYMLDFVLEKGVLKFRFESTLKNEEIYKKLKEKLSSDNTVLEEIYK